MRWERTHHATSGPVHGVGLLHWDASRGVLIDVIGKRQWLEVELLPRVDGSAVAMTSARQWLRYQDFAWPFHGSSSAARERASGKSPMGASASA